MSMTISYKKYGLEYINCEKRIYFVHNSKIYFISRHWSQPWLSWSWRRRRNFSCRIRSAEQRLRDHDEFIPFGLFTFLSVSCYLAKYFKLGVLVAIFVGKNTVKIMWKNLLRISISYPKHFYNRDKEKEKTRNGL